MLAGTEVTGEGGTLEEEGRELELQLAGQWVCIPKTS